MRKASVILSLISIALSLISLFSSCARKAIPSVTTTDSTVVERKDSVVVKDTTIIIPAKKASMATTIDSLQQIIQQLQEENRDTVIRIPRNDSDRTDSAFMATVEVKRDGTVVFNCKEDSLKLVIRNLITRYLELFISKQKTTVVTKLVAGPVQIETHIPKWMWWVLAYAVCSVGWKIAKLFISPGTSILDILKHWFTKWK